MFKNRQKVEELVYKVLDALDSTGQNTQFYKNKFAKMDDKEFIEFFKQNFSIKFQTKLFEVEPKINQVKKALDILNVPLVEKLNMPFLYKNDKGEPVTSQEALVVYPPIKKMKQFVAKKNSMSTNISKRDMKTGLLLSVDKNGNTSDREMESLGVLGMDYTMRELATYRADSMNAKNEFYNEINTTGMVSQKDVKVSKDDSLARNELNTYFLGAGLNSNLINEGDFLLYTLKGKQRKTERES